MDLHSHSHLGQTKAVTGNSRIFLETFAVVYKYYDLVCTFLKHFLQATYNQLDPCCTSFIFATTTQHIACNTKIYFSHPQIPHAGFYREARDIPGSKSTVTINDN